MMRLSYSLTRRSRDVEVYEFQDDGVPLTCVKAWRLMATSRSFRVAVIDMLERSAYSAYFFQTPVATPVDSIKFRVELVDAPSLVDAAVDESTFAGAQSRCTGLACSFENLGRDAVLVTPTPRRGVATSYYSSVAPFFRHATSAQKHALLKEVGRVAQGQMERWGVAWVSTSGSGVHWLHFRVERTPKYYTGKGRWIREAAAVRHR